MSGMDRRSFFKDGSKEGMEFFLKRLGFVGQFAGQHVIKEVPKIKTEKKTETKLLESGDPINSRGDPLGGRISGFSLIPQTRNPAFPDCYLLVLAHAEKLRVPTGVVAEDKKEALELKGLGASVLEIKKNTLGLWKQIPANPRNIRLHPDNTDGLFNAINGCFATPWNSVLLFEKDGYLWELHPQRGTLVKREAVGLIGNPAGFSLGLVSGAKAEIVIQVRGERTQIIKFTSDLCFDAHHILSNSKLLERGQCVVLTDSYSQPENMMKFGIAQEYGATLDSKHRLVCRNTEKGVEVIVRGPDW